MSRSLRGWLLGTIALAFLYLLVHAREPLRLNLGDPWSDANVLASVNGVKSYAFAEVFYRSIGKFLGVSDIGTFRMFALAWSGLAMWLLFAYVRRLYSDRIALIATALLSTSLMWMMYADSIHQTPIVMAMMFLALWGLMRVIETKQPRHYAAAFLGSFGAFYASTECYIFLPAAVLVTVYLDAGNPFARGRRHFVAVCAAGCMLGLAVRIGAVGWEAFLADLELQSFATSDDRKAKLLVFPTLVRRLTLVLTPFAWIAASFHALKAIRAPSVGAALKDTAAWMLLAALAFVALFPQLAATQMLASQVFLPFYAIGSALVVDWLLERSKPFQRFAIIWLVAAPLWAFYILFTHKRSFLDRDDVAKTTAYLAANDHNDFVLSSLMAAGPVRTSFQRHEWKALALDVETPSYATTLMMRIFEETGTDSVHELIAKGPDSRFIDTALWSLAMARRKWSITGWPHLNRAKTKAVIAEYDRRVMVNLEAVGASKMLDLRNYAVYRVARSAIITRLGEAVPSTDHIDFGQRTATHHLLLGWKAPYVLATEQKAVTTIEGFRRCQERSHGSPCRTIRTPSGSRTELAPYVSAAQLMIRVDRLCDLRLTFAFATDSYVRFTLNDFTVTPRGGRTVTFSVPATNLTPGINVLELDSLLPREVGVHLASLDLAPACPAQ